jgi:hypothetical protein
MPILTSNGDFLDFAKAGELAIAHNIETASISVFINPSISVVPTQKAIVAPRQQGVQK